MTDFRVLVLDLDGTTLDARRRVAEIDLRAARALQAAGVRLTIATGRLFTGTRWAAEELGIRGSVAVMNGSEIVDVESARASHGRYLDRGVRDGIHRTLKDRGLATFLFESRRIHYGRIDAHHAEYLATWTEDLSHHADVFDIPSWGSSVDLLAVGVAGRSDEIAAARDALHRVLPPEVETVLFSTHRGDAFLKLRHASEDKGTALRRLAAEHGTTAEHCVAVGDWINDIPMLKVAGRSYAMGHAGPEVRAAAHEVLDAAGNGGAIAEVARRVWGITV